MSSVLGLIRRIYTPLKFGILGAAAVAPDALINPAKSHPEAVVYVVAADSQDRATVSLRNTESPRSPRSTGGALMDMDSSRLHHQRDALRRRRRCPTPQPRSTTPLMPRLFPPS
ncbi:hypothetical protein B0H17DRAFT_367481 [Mycena rosella]|uniref:Gfo/Idh/MocA-like oxidoreductase N-terminal domain-containing protein n=1 Tax=Mycena rosella TaxID=1033263 RepID=A0AAD7GZK2_MYCRO|nr:hypothetical protein B0H17DRAFT_367481 [Mycena rosella]